MSELRALLTKLKNAAEKFKCNAKEFDLVFKKVYVTVAKLEDSSSSSKFEDVLCILDKFNNKHDRCIIENIEELITSVNGELKKKK